MKTGETRASPAQGGASSCLSQESWTVWRTTEGEGRVLGSFLERRLGVMGASGVCCQAHRRLSSSSWFCDVLPI